MSGPAEKIDFKKLQRQLQNTSSDRELFQAIVNAPFDQRLPVARMFLGIIVFLQVNKTTKTIDRCALSETELAKNTLEVTTVPFEKIKIPIISRTNILATAIRDYRPYDTTDWRFLFDPALSSQEARVNQASAGIAYSAVYPIKARDGGALIFSYFQYVTEIGEFQTDFMAKYTKLVDQSLEIDAPR